LIANIFAIVIAAQIQSLIAFDFVLSFELNGQVNALRDSYAVFDT